MRRQFLRETPAGHPKASLTLLFPSVALKLPLHIAGGLTGYSLFAITRSVHFLPVLEYFAVALYTLAATQAVKH